MSRSPPMVGPDDPRPGDRCGEPVARDDAIRTERTGGLDPGTWRTLCCPACGGRPTTVFVGSEGV